jgi:hypothetical protein
MNNEIKLQSIIKCRECGFEKEERMPTDPCVFFTSAKIAKQESDQSKEIVVFIAVTEV